jgi:hypothetical protein
LFYWPLEVFVENIYKKARSRCRLHFFINDIHGLPLLPGRRCESNERVQKIGPSGDKKIIFEIRKVPSLEISGFLVPVTK